VAVSRPWHPPLVNNANYMLMQAELEDADREENTGTVSDDRRLVAARQKLQWAQKLGRDADVGLTNWTSLANKICVLDADCVPGASKEGWVEPELRRRAMSQFILKASKIAYAVGAVAVVVPSPPNPDGSTTLNVPRVPAPDMFDENTGKWDPDALNRDRVPIPVIVVAPPSQVVPRLDPATATMHSNNECASQSGLGRGVLRPGTLARVQPEAPNFAFRQKTGISALVYLDMVGDTDFDVVLVRADKCHLDTQRAVATVRIVTQAAKHARNEEGAHKAAHAVRDKEEDEAQAAEAAALKERQEADEAEEAFREEERQAKLAEHELEEKIVLFHEAEHAASRVRAAAELREAHADSLQNQCTNGRLEIKELLQRHRELTNLVKHQGKRNKRPPGGKVLTPEAELLAVVSDEYNAAVRKVDEAARELDTVSAEMDAGWQEVEEAQTHAHVLHDDVFAAEVRFRKEKAEAELARVRRDKEVAEAEEAEENARRERAEAEAAKAAAFVAEELAAHARAGEKAQREDFERRVADAAYAMEKAEEEKVSSAAVAAELAQRDERKERERMLKMLAAQAEKRQLDAEAEAKVRAESEAKFREMAGKREADLQALRGAVEEEQGDGDVDKVGGGLLVQGMRKSERFPWRRTRTSMEPGFTRQPRPALANDFLHVMQGWEGDTADVDSSRRSKTAKDGGAGAIDKRIADVTLNLPQHLRKAAGGAALSLATADYLQALKEWDVVEEENSILEGHNLKLSGRCGAPDAQRELWPVNLPENEGTLMANGRETSYVELTTPVGSSSRMTTPALGASVPTSVGFSRVPSNISRSASSKVKFLEDEPSHLTRRPSVDLAAVHERLQNDMN